MERKIGEIFEFGGEWYQCIIGHCNQCSFDEAGTCKFIGNPYCAYRNDKKLACFKKLEKVGEPYEYFIQGMGIIIVQEYILANTNYIWEYNQDVVVMDCQNGKVAIEIKQNKENMEQEIEYFGNESNNEKHSNSESIGKNLKPFYLEAAKAGKPVCTRDGRKARIICFDRNDLYPIVALIECEDGKEIIGAYSKEGQTEIYEIKGTNLMMLPEKKEGWVNVRRLKSPGDNDFPYVSTLYPTKEEAITNANLDVIDTIKVSWEE